MTHLITYQTLSSPIDKSEIEQNFTDFTDYLASGSEIHGREFKRYAGIKNSQLAAKYLQTTIELRVNAIHLAAGWPASGVLAAVMFRPRSQIDGLQTINLRDAHWMCTDTGAGVGTFELQWGSFENGSWVGTAISGASDTITNGAGLNDTNEEHFIIGSTNTWLPPSGYTQQNLMGIALVATGADIAAMNFTYSFFSCRCILRTELLSR